MALLGLLLGSETREKERELREEGLAGQRL